MEQCIVRSTGICPETGSSKTIDITFAVIRLAGGSEPGYKAISFFCDIAADGECTHCGSSGANCPLFRSAIHETK